MQFEDIAKSFSLKKFPESEVELSGDIPHEAILPKREEALRRIASELELPGFRKGHVPHDMALKKVGETAVLEEAVELFIKDFYPALIEAHSVDAVGRPQIAITKLAPGNPVGLRVVAAVYPEIKLPKDYKTLGERVVQEATLPATDEEVDKTLENLRASSAKASDGQAVALPEINDEFAKSLGAFENLAALKEQIKKGITEEKERKAVESRRGKIIDTLLEGTKVDVPRIFVESELEKIISQMKEDIARFGLTFEGYLAQVKKTEEDLRSEFREQAKKRAKLQLALNKIAEIEEIKADEEKVQSEMKHALEHFPNANPELVRIHIETVLRNEKVFQLLEEEKTSAS